MRSHWYLCGSLARLRVRSGAGVGASAAHRRRSRRLDARSRRPGRRGRRRQPARHAVRRRRLEHLADVRRGTQLVAGRSRRHRSRLACRLVSITGSSASASRSTPSAGATRARSRRRISARLRVLRSRALAHRLRLRDARHRDSVHAHGAARRHAAPRRSTYRPTASPSTRVSPLAKHWQLYFGLAEHDYERNLNVLPRIDSLNLLSTSTLTLANGFLDHERSVAVERELGRVLLNVRVATDRSAIDDSKFETRRGGGAVPDRLAHRSRSEPRQWPVGVLRLRPLRRPTVPGLRPLTRAGTDFALRGDGFIFTPRSGG